MREKNVFQSTRPVRGATSSRCTPCASTRHFNPRAPCGARPTRPRTTTARMIFQSTRPVRGATGALLPPLTTILFQSTRPVRGATGRQLLLLDSHFVFQSTRPVRGATAMQGTTGRRLSISIHAPRAGRDPRRARLVRRQPEDFNPRAPCGARRAR